MIRFIAILVLCCASAGCLDPPVRPDPPAPEPESPVAADSITAFGQAVAEATRSTYLETARKLDAGQIKTADAMIADETSRYDAAFDKAAQALSDREQRETNTGGPWTPARASQYRKRVAQER